MQNFSAANLNGTTFVNAKLNKQTILSGAKSINLSGADLREFDLKQDGINLKEIPLNNVDLSYKYFSEEYEYFATEL